MNLLARRVAAYLDELVPPRPARLAELEAEARRTGFPIIGPATGHLCYLLARLSNARHVFELGSGFGYSTAWFNLGIALEDRRRPNDAVKAYEQAIVADRRLADAYFNLARLYEQAGKPAAALRNLSKYRLLTDR